MIVRLIMDLNKLRYVLPINDKDSHLVTKIIYLIVYAYILLTIRYFETVTLKVD